jgi:hypothetical protein
MVAPLLSGLSNISISSSNDYDANDVVLDGPLLVESNSQTFNNGRVSGATDAKSLLLNALDRIRADLQSLKDKHTVRRDAAVYRQALEEPLSLLMVPILETREPVTRAQIAGSKYFGELAGSGSMSNDLYTMRELFLERHIAHHLQFLLQDCVPFLGEGLAELDDILDSYFGQCYLQSICG